MLCCIVCSKQGEPSIETVPEDGISRSPAVKEGIRSISSQVKEIAVRLAYRHCRPCSSSAIRQREESYVVSLDVADTASEIAPSNSFSLSHFLSTYTFPPIVVARHVPNNGHSVVLKSPEQTSTPTSATRTQEAPAVKDVEEEWVAQVEPGVLITFVALNDGGNALKRIRFSRAMFNKWQAEEWWAENCEKVRELYNVPPYDRSTPSLPVPSRSEDELKTSLERDCRLLYAHDCLHRHYQNWDNLSNGSCQSSALQSGIRDPHRTSASCQDAQTTSDMDADRPEGLKSSGEGISISNASEQEIEWVEEDDPGVYITIRSVLDGMRELKRVRFSREKFTEAEARIWWEENRRRIREEYL